jgi:hypothetical protein
MKKNSFRYTELELTLYIYIIKQTQNENTKIFNNH